MKKMSIIVAALFLLSACNSEEKDAGKKIKYVDLIADGLKGEVSGVAETPYKTDSSGKVGEMDSCCIDSWQYDENGNYTGSIQKDSKGTVKNERVAERYEDGLFKGEKTMKDGKTTSKLETKLDDKGNWASATSWDSAGKMDFYYLEIGKNEFGQVTSWKQYDKDSVFRQEFVGKFDKTLQTSYQMKDSTGKVKSSGSSKYNDKGEQTESSNTTMVKDSATTKVTKYSYDSHDETGNWTQRTEWDEKGKATKVIKRSYTYRKKEEEKK